jgi:type I restriction enzyme, S subunit
MAVDEWIRYTVSEIASQERNALVGGPFGSNLVTKDYVSSGIPVIRGQNMGFGRWVDGEFAFVTTEKAESLSANIARPGDLVFTQRGTLGQVAIVPSNRFHRYVVSQSQMKLTVDPTKVDANYLYYVFRSDKQQDYIRRNTIQTGVPHTNLGLLRETPLSLPSLSTQKAIAHILGTLDDKIELNRRMNETLEAIARAIFKSWFVDFEPIPGIGPHEEWEESPVGKIPQGWIMGILEDIVEILDSKRIPLSKKEREVRKGKYPYYGAASIVDYVDDHLFEGVHVLMSEDGANVVDDQGFPLLQYVWGQFWVNNHAHVLRGKDGISTEYVFLLLKQTNASHMVTGAVQPKINQKNMKQLPAIIPTGKASETFSDFISTFFDRIRLNADQITVLSEMRDTLLPRLLSGELRIKDAERFASKAV